MEEKRANGAEIDDGAINGIKVGLMGTAGRRRRPYLLGYRPRPYSAALGGIAMSGSLANRLLFFILLNSGASGDRHYGAAYGYRKGVRYR